MRMRLGPGPVSQTLPLGGVHGPVKSEMGALAAALPPPPPRAECPLFPTTSRSRKPTSCRRGSRHGSSVRALSQDRTRLFIALQECSALYSVRDAAALLNLPSVSCSTGSACTHSGRGEPPEPPSSSYAVPRAHWNFISPQNPHHCDHRDGGARDHARDAFAARPA